jgi:hypothetical protein
MAIGLYIKPLLYQFPRRNFSENSKKAPKGIDKMKIRFIIRIVGKSGEKG